MVHSQVHLWCLSLTMRKEQFTIVSIQGSQFEGNEHGFSVRTTQRPDICNRLTTSPDECNVLSSPSPFWVGRYHCDSEWIEESMAVCAERHLRKIIRQWMVAEFEQPPWYYTNQSELYAKRGIWSDEICACKRVCVHTHAWAGAHACIQYVLYVQYVLCVARLVAIAIFRLRKIPPLNPRLNRKEMAQNLKETVSLIRTLPQTIIVF
jgi:hypothetical protein